MRITTALEGVFVVATATGVAMCSFLAPFVPPASRPERPRQVSVLEARPSLRDAYHEAERIESPEERLQRKLQLLEQAISSREAR